LALLKGASLCGAEAHTSVDPPAIPPKRSP
jgi:hypothetical protein